MVPSSDPLVSAFSASFGVPPTGVAIAPGRVNLIGDHTDYNGLPVLPMAFDRGIRIVFRADPQAVVTLENQNQRFPPASFPLTAPIPMGPAGHWGNYPRAVAVALLERGPLARGILGLVSSDLPPASGLSSSSALVVATALALLEANGAACDSGTLMQWLAVGERLVGTEGGGMDQAVILGGQAGHAIRIDFTPGLSLRPVRIPPSWRIVVASSLVEAAKSGLVREAYNTRVLECREALLGVGEREAGGFGRLMQLPEPDRVLARAEAVLSATLFRRFRHVLTEGHRVEQATVALETGDYRGMGRLLDASHASLRDDYQVSCPALDELVTVAREAGAVGARLTGAGFGGCIVALADEDSVGQVTDRIWERYYQPRQIPAANRDALLFTAVPSDGARIATLG
ncbi:MAG: galactokinase [Gemmatimonadota bacterium]